MATTTAQITLTSTDIADNALSISNTMTLTTAGTETGITETTGLARKKIASASLADLITVANTDVTAAKSAKVYIKNTSTATDKYGLVGIGDSGGTPIYIGRLYGGDWMLIPWDANSGEDITMTMNDATETIIEYMVFFE
tara:strand:+ start:166 stop:585 length:420 start_codon:yes stop_codon:yes gene_type:complete